MIAAHSPSPWISCHSHIDDADGRTIIRSERKTFDSLNPLDMHIAAAAPEMLELLVDLSKKEDGRITENDVARIKAVIDKACGQ